MKWAFLLQILPVAFVAMAASFFCTKWIKGIAMRHGIVDDPRSATRKIHTAPTPLLGGVAIVIACIVALAAAYGPFQLPSLPMEQLAWLSAAVFVIVVGGVLDDKWNLPARTQILFPLLAASMVVVGAEVTIERIPGMGLAEFAPSVSMVITILWLMGMTYTTKLMDGLDGLATGIGAIGAAMIALLSLTAAYFQPDIAVVAVVVCGALLGFLAWNFNPAHIFLGEAGSEGIGFILGVLAIISGSKIATALLVLGIPMLDIFHVMWLRIRAGKSPFTGDKNHLHYKLAQKIGVRKTVYVLYAVSAAFGLTTLSLQTQTKVAALIAVVITGIGLTNFASAGRK